jgi:hypothetical protein
MPHHAVQYMLQYIVQYKLRYMLQYIMQYKLWYMLQYTVQYKLWYMLQYIVQYKLRCMLQCIVQYELQTSPAAVRTFTNLCGVVVEESRVTGTGAATGCVECWRRQVSAGGSRSTLVGGTGINICRSKVTGALSDMHGTTCHSQHVRDM